MKYTLHLGDCLEYMATMPDNSVDSIVTDPPYGLRFMSKRWDYDVPSVAIWAECLRVLKPGGHMLAFGGSRTYHRMVVNVEDAGFEIRDQIMWVYGSGFPKSMDVSKAIDKMAGAKREVIGRSSNYSRGRKKSWGFSPETGWNQNSNGHDTSTYITAPSTDAAQQWDGYGTALKPAHEPIVLARKPIDGTIAANVLEWGTGAINIDGCRVPIADGATMARNNKPGSNGWKNSSGGMNSAALNGEPAGRWPANFIHDGSDEVLAGFPGVTSGGRGNGGQGKGLRGNTFFHACHNPLPGDKGSAARFFYCAKASKAERTCGGTVDNNHPTVKPQSLMAYLCRLITPPDGVVLDPFMGSGSTGIAALNEGFRFVGIERDSDSYTTAGERIATGTQQMSLL